MYASIADNVEYTIVSSSAAKLHDPKFARNWRFMHSRQDVKPWSVLVSEVDGRYTVDCHDVYYKFDRLETRPLGSFVSTVLLPKCFVKGSEGYCLDSRVAETLETFGRKQIISMDTTNVPEEMIDTKMSSPLTDVCVVGNFYNVPESWSPDNLIPKDSVYARVWYIKDMIRGPTSFPERDSAYSYEIFGKSFGLQGIPVHIKPRNDWGANDPVGRAKTRWSDSLTAMQSLATAFSFKSNKLKPVEYSHNDLPSDFQEYESVVENKCGDTVSRRIYNTYIRHTRESRVMFGRGIPPIENPFGKQLIGGKGMLPYFGANHGFAVMFVFSCPNAFRFGYDEALCDKIPLVSDLNMERVCESAFPGKQNAACRAWAMTNVACHGFTILYHGYLPHCDNTLHAWRECTILCPKIITPYALLNDDGTTRHNAMECEIISAWKYLNRDPVCPKSLFSAISSDEFERLLSPDLWEFMSNGMHITSGDELYNWSLMAPLHTKEIVNEWFFDNIAMVNEAAINIGDDTLGYDDKHMAMMFRSFRIPMPSPKHDETVKSLLERGYEMLYDEPAPDTPTKWIAAFARHSDVLNTNYTSYDLLTAVSNDKMLQIPLLEKMPKCWDGLFFKTGENVALHYDTFDGFTNTQKLLMEMLTIHTSRWLNAANKITGRGDNGSWDDHVSWLSSVRTGVLSADDTMQRSVYIRLL